MNIKDYVEDTYNQLIDHPNYVVMQSDDVTDEIKDLASEMYPQSLLCRVLEHY